MDGPSYTTNSLDFEGYTNLSLCKPTITSTVKNIFTSIQICTIMSSTIQPWFITNNQGDKHGCDWQAYTGKRDVCLIHLSMQSMLQEIQMTIILALTYTLSQFPSKKIATTQLWDQEYELKQYFRDFMLLYFT